MNIIRNAHGEAAADLAFLNRMEAERGEVKETTRDELQEIAKRGALETIGEALEDIGSRLTKKRRENAAQAIHCARVKLMRDADTTAKDVRAALKVLSIVDNGAENTADELGAFNDWNDVPAVVRNLLERLGYPVETAAEETAAEEPAEPKTIAQRFAEKRAERENFEAFEAAYFEAHPCTAKTYRTRCSVLEAVKEQAKEIRSEIEAAKRGDELAAVGPAGTSPNGLPLYWDHFDAIEAPEYLAKLEKQRAELSDLVARTRLKIRASYEAREAAKKEAEETEDGGPFYLNEASDRARSAYLNTCDECEAIEATGTREAVHEAKKLRTLAAEALAHYLRTHAPEWVEELETLHREACAYSPNGLQNQRSGAEGIGYHPRE